MLFPKKNDLSVIERIALSLVLNFAIVSLLGLVLNFTPFGIRLESVLIVLSTFTILISVVTWSRRLKMPAKKRFRVPFERLLKIYLGQSVLDKGLSIVLIATIIGSCATLTYVIVKPKTDERFTEFYLLDSKGIAFNYPIDLNVGGEGKMIIVIVNNEYKNMNYNLKVNFNGTRIYEEHIFLTESEKWESFFTFQAIEKIENQKLEFLLYKDQQIEAYRTLHLYVSIRALDVVLD